MKKINIFAVLLFAAFALCVGCESSNDSVGSTDEVEVTIDLSNVAAMTRTDGSTDADDEVIELTRYKVEVYYAGDYETKLVAESYSSGDNISLRLVKGYEYDLAFWADKGGYDAANLRSVRWKDIESVEGDRRIAFAGNCKNVLADGSFTLAPVLTRPVAKINYMTSTPSESSLQAGDRLSIKYDQLSKLYNVLTEEYSTESTFDIVNTCAEVTLDSPFASDYVFPSSTGDVDVEISFQRENSDGDYDTYQTKSITTLPTSKNVITNVTFPI